MNNNFVGTKLKRSIILQGNCLRTSNIFNPKTKHGYNKPIILNLKEIWHIPTKNDKPDKTKLC